MYKHNNLRGRNLYTVYKITFPNNKIYIGFTEVGILERVKTHISASKKRITKIHNAFNKYDNFKVQVINCYSTRKLALYMERHYINRYNSTGKNGYNIQSGGQYVPLARIKKGRKVIDCRGNIFNTITECADFYGVTIASIRLCCINKWKVLRKYNVKFYEEGDTKCSKFTHIKKVKCLNNNQIYKNAEEAKEQLGLKSSLSIRRVCRGERNHYAGFNFEYILE